MIKKLIKLISVLIFLCVIIISLGVIKKIAPDMFKNAILKNLPFLGQFVQTNFSTYTSITGIKDQMKLVTAKKQLDFINIMDGKDGRYVEISTYEVKAGIDCSKIKIIQNEDGKSVSRDMPTVEIFSSNKIHPIVLRSAAMEGNTDFYSNCVKPINRAYEQKAKDYAVELGILTEAKEGAEHTLKNLLGGKVNVPDDTTYTKYVDIPYLPLELEIYEKYMEKNRLEFVSLSKDYFNRDSLIIQSVNNDNWHIRIGDSGMKFKGTFNDFYHNMYETNVDKNNKKRDSVEIFRYFDPMHPRECEVLSYASDYYRTFFVLSGGRIYYIDVDDYPSEQTLIDDISPSMIYFASSIRRIKDKKVDYVDEYATYTENFYDVAKCLRNRVERRTMEYNVGKLIKSNVINQSGNLTPEEKYLKTVSEVIGLDYTKKTTICQTDNEYYDNITYLTQNLKVSPDNLTTDESRDIAIKTAISLNQTVQKSDNINLYLPQYLEAYFLQNGKRLNISRESKNEYKEDLKNTGAIVYRPLIAEMTESERNEYYYNLFKNRLYNSHYYVDTARSNSSMLKKSSRKGSMYVYFDIPQESMMADGDVDERLTKINNENPVEDCFVFIFKQIDWNIGDVFEDTDIHAFVMDDATFRFFPNVSSQNFLEATFDKFRNDLPEIKENPLKFGLKKIISFPSDVGRFVRDSIPDDTRKKLEDKFPKLKKFNEAIMRKTDNSPTYFAFGDWKNLRITPENVKIAGHNFGTTKLTKKGKDDYRDSNDYAEKSAIAILLDDFQHAYNVEEPDYYRQVMCEKLDEQIQDYVYNQIFRPSPRLRLDVRKDENLRYNK